MLHGFFRKIAPLAAMAMATGLAGCDGMDIKINDMEGVPLADLDMSGDASVQILGSGKVAVASVATDSLDVTIAGSGSYDAAGTTKSMDMTVAGSGGASMAALKVDGAKISILGSGSAEFASEGDVSAEMMGSGNVTIIGSATCKVKSMGSGTVTCKNVTQEGK